jgi:type II secretory pathway pseudopilin PulG
MTQIRMKGRRQAFTLVELLIVVAIIFILVGLLSAAVMAAMRKGPEAQVRSEIDTLSAAIGAFKQDFSVNYVPSQLKLYSTIKGYISTGNGGTNPSPSQLDNDSLAFLQAMFGKRLGTGATPLNWDGTGASSWPVTLQGQECLVFLLGGIPNGTSPPGCLGFSTDPTNPTTSGGTRKGPYYDFQTSRLVTGKPNANFYCYLDPFTPNGGNRQPYAFFSAYKTANGYNRYGPSGDCSNLTNPPTQPYSPMPYFQTGASGNVFFNSTSFQIISAGPDGNFGPGGNTFNPASGTVGPGANDFSNFSKSRLGAPQS